MRQSRLGLVPTGIFASLLLAGPAQGASGYSEPDEGLGTAQKVATTLVLDLGKAISLALEKNKKGKITRADLEAALARHQQALSSWWPEVSAQLMGARMDQDPNFLFPPSQMYVPGNSLEIPPMTFTLPAGSFAPGLPGTDLPVTVPPSTVDVPAQLFPIPAQDIKLMDRDYAVGTVNITFPIYTGGLRGAKIRQAKSGIEAAQEEERRTDQEVIYDVTRLYYSGILAKRLVRVASDTLARMEATLDLTERLYKTGSGTVKKTDYLRNKSIVATLRSVVAGLESKQDTAEAALLTVMGVDWATPVKLLDEQLPFKPRETEPLSLIETAFHANPLLGKIAAGIRAAEAEIRAARSGYLPKVGFIGSVTGIANEYDAGTVTPENKKSWSVGIGVDIPIFQGFRVKNEEREARAMLLRLHHQKALLRDGIALEVKRTCFDLAKSRRQEKSTGDALQSAIENRELNIRAYQEELVETKDVIEAQLLEAFVAAQYERIRYDHVQGNAKLDFVLGTPVDLLKVKHD